MYQRILLASNESDKAYPATRESYKFLSLRDDMKTDVLAFVDYKNSKNDINHVNVWKVLIFERWKKNRSVSGYLGWDTSKRIRIILHEISGTAITYKDNKNTAGMLMGSPGLIGFRAVNFESLSQKIVGRVNKFVIVIKNTVR